MTSTPTSVASLPRPQPCLHLPLLPLRLLLLVLPLLLLLLPLPLWHRRVAHRSLPGQSPLLSNGLSNGSCRGAIPCRRP